MSYVVGTAGHIDHGKSALIQALTGIDPDRLEEEKRRGMTIDLGFAYLTLPSGRLVGIVDVPGHARFIRNMLAGVHGLDAVLLVVAADEGVMPQTREHLEIIDLLEIDRGIAVLTKKDLVDAEWLELVASELSQALAETSLRGAEILAVSSVTGEGLDVLLARLDALLAETPERIDRGRPRLPIDRVFTIRGSGTVVTGTLVEGSLRLGDELEVQPSGRSVRIRGLQQHGVKVERAVPGSRAAVNLVGVDKDDLRRGDVLARPGTVRATRRIDASVRVLAGAPRPLRHGAHVLVHTGTAEVAARAIVLDRDAVLGGDVAWIQLYLQEPIAAAAGDRYVLRIPSPSLTLAGGRFADVAARRHPRGDERVTESLGRRAAGAVLQEELRKYPRGITGPALLKASLAEGASPAALDSLDAHRAGGWLFASQAWTALTERARELLDDYHRRNPLRAGMPREELQSRLGLQPAAFGPVLAEMVALELVAEAGGAIARPGHAVTIDASGGPAARLLELLGGGGFAPPSLAEAMREAGAGPDLVRALVAQGVLVRVSQDVAFTRAAYDAAVELVREVAARDGSVTVASMRDALGASRRPVLALLEYLDGRRVTRRVGDARVLR